MSYSCDFCGKKATLDYKISCERCYSFLTYLLSALKESNERIMPKKKKNKKIKLEIRKTKVSKIFKEPRAIEEVKKEDQKKNKTEREKKFEEFLKNKSADPMTKCATCEHSFLDASGKISCTEGKEPGTCGY